MLALEDKVFNLALDSHFGDWQDVRRLTFLPH
jgi:hypothetical protein